MHRGSLVFDSAGAQRGTAVLHTSFSRVIFADALVKHFLTFNGCFFSRGRFSKQFVDSIDVTLLTNDRANLALAQEAKVSAMTIHSYVESVRGQYPDLAELLAPEESSAADVRGESNAPRKPANRRGGERVLLFEEHKPMSELTAGIQQGRYVCTQWPAFLHEVTRLCTTSQKCHRVLNVCLLGCSLGCDPHRYFQGPLRAERSSSNRCYVVAQGKQVGSIIGTTKCTIGLQF